MCKLDGAPGTSRVGHDCVPKSVRREQLSRVGYVKGIIIKEKSEI